MIRTPAQTRRRQGLTNAAAGRTAVVLYACVEGSRTDALATLAELRQFAKAREWVIVDVILDTTPLSTPLDKRPMWRSVREAIAEGQAEGIVAAQGHTCDDVDDTRAQLSNWLAEHAAFLTTARCGVRSSHTAERSQL